MSNTNSIPGAAASGRAERAPLPLVAWPDAYPEWDDLTVEERDAERRKGSWSAYFDEFTFGYCRNCEDREAVATEDENYTICCGERIQSVESAEDAIWRDPDW